MPTDEVRLKFTADLGDLTAELSKNRNLTKDEVKKLVQQMAKVQESATKATSKAAKEAEKAAKETTSAWEKAAKGLGEILGVQGLVDQYFDLSEAAEDSGKTMGKWGFRGAVAAAGVAAALVGVTAALVETAQAAQEALDRFDELGLAEIVTAAQRQAVEDTTASLESLSVSIGALQVSVTALVSGPLRWMIDKLTEAGLVVTRLSAGFQSGGISVDWYAAALWALATPFIKIIQLAGELEQKLFKKLGWEGLAKGSERFNEFLDEQQRALTDNAFTFDLSNDKLKEALALNDSAAVLHEQVAKGLKKLKADKDADTAATKESTEALKTQALAIKMLGALSREAGESISTAANKAASSVGASAGIMAGTFIKAVEVIDQKLEESREKQKALMDSIKATIESILSSANSIFADISGLIMAAHERSLESIDEQIEAERKYFKTATGADKEASKKRLENLKRQKEAQKESMMDVWKAQQAAAITMAVINGILAGVTTLAQLGATPWGIAAAALAVAAGTTAAVAIAAEPPPKFHTGMTPGLSPVETPATLDRGEAVLNRRAVADLGTEVIGRANRGTLRQQGGGSAMTAIFLNDRVVDHITANGILRGGQTRLALATVPNYKGGYK